MGLQHKAIHAMLANPHLAPFELIDRPRQPQDWTLIDHLMVIHKVKESDYVEGDSGASIVNMARTLACGYISENADSRFVVLVKDGARAQKPAVRESRLKRTPVPHIEFCKRNLCAIEYTAMKLLADVGMKNKLFLVTGAKGDSSEDELLERTSVDNLVSFHQKYLDCKESRDDILSADTLEGLNLPELELSYVDPRYADGSVDRPEGLKGVFVATFADPETEQVSVLRDACLRCRSTEADMLLVELANILKGSVTLCTGDSDVVAVLTACGREGITIRMDNKSYSDDRDMHMSTFGELLFEIPKNRPLKLPFIEMASMSGEDRFRLLCDVAAEDEHLLPTARKQHDEFEAVLDEHGGVEFKKDVAWHLYLGGIRGSVYCTFLSRFFELHTPRTPSSNSFRLDALGRFARTGSAKTAAAAIFELFPASHESPLSECESDDSPSACKKSKMQEHEVPQLDLDDCPEPVVLNKEQKKVMAGLKRLSTAYMHGMVPKDSHGRFLRLTRVGRHYFMRMKADVIRDETERMKKLFFMALCGTDYNLVPMGLGIKRLMTGVITNYESFSSWCQKLKNLLWGDDSASCQDRDYYNMGMRLAGFTNIQAATRSKHWTEVNCSLMVKTMKYVCELWNLKRPKPGSEYGFSVHDGVVCFDRKESPLADAASEIE